MFVRVYLIPPLYYYIIIYLLYRQNKSQSSSLANSTEQRSSSNAKSVCCSRNSLSIIETESSMPNSQEPITGPYREPTYTVTPSRSTVTAPIYCISQVVSSLQVIRPKYCIHFSFPLRATRPAHLIVLDLIALTIFGEFINVAM